MRSFRPVAVVLLIASSLALVAGCASEPSASEKQATALNPCLGVAPFTGTMLRRGQDCGAGQATPRDDTTASREAARQLMVDDIRSMPSTGRSPVKP